MKILFVIDSIKNGGAERVLNIMANEFVKNHNVEILFFNEKQDKYKFNKNIKFHKLNTYNFFKKINKLFLLRRFFKKNKADLIISFIDWTNVACVIANFCLKSKLIATEHNEHKFLKKPYSIIRNFVYRFVDGLSVLNKQDFKYYHFVKNKEILHNPIYFKNENFKKENIILSVSRLEKVKSLDTFLIALSKIQDLKGFKIKIAGIGSLENELKNLAKDLKLNVDFLGHVDDVNELYKKAKIFVLTSKSEGLSNVLLESANFDCARIASDTFGSRELIENNFNGLIYKNEEELVYLLQKLISDENLRLLLAENAKLNLVNFDVNNIIDKWYKFIDKVMSI